MPLSFFRDSVIVKRAGITKKNGMEIFDWSNATSKTIDRVQVTAQASSMEFSGRTLNLTDKRLLRASYDADIKAGDHVIWNGEEYAIDGEVFHTKSPAGGASTTRCTLIRWQG